MAFWDFLNNTKRYVGNIYEGGKKILGNVFEGVKKGKNFMENRI